MKRSTAALIVIALAFALVAAVATDAQAFPNKTSQCTGCHSLDTAVGVTATQASNNGTVATYNVSVSDAYGDGVTGWAVFDGTTNIVNGYGPGSFSVADGKTYKVFGVAGAGGIGANSVSISPVAPPPPADTTPPLVSITSPADGATVAGSVAVGASASDVGSGVARVEFRIDGSPLVADAISPYSATWNSATAAPGAHTIEAIAFDNAGLSTTARIQVSIAPPPPADTTPPLVSITSPADGATVAGSVAVGASASDVGSGVARVEFRIDGSPLVADAISPYSATWNSATAAPGAHTIEAIAFDNAGLSTTARIQVSIATPPPVSTSLLTVNVVTATGGPISGAKILMRNVVTGARYTRTADASGSAQFADLTYGTYSIAASARGYSRARTSIVVDTPAETASLSLTAR